MTLDIYEYGELTEWYLERGGISLTRTKGLNHGAKMNVTYAIDICNKIWSDNKNSNTKSIMRFQKKEDHFTEPMVSNTNPSLTLS